MKCFYHRTDLDGHCSGAIVKNAHKHCQMIGVDYKDSLTSLGVTFEPGETVYVLDFSFDLEDTAYLNEHCDLIWIDHHKSAIEKLASLLGIKGLREIGKAGCELTWEYVHPNTGMPYAVHLLGRYDVWDHEDERVLPFQWGMRSIKSTLPDEEELWLDVFGDPGAVGRLCKTGRVILDYQTQQDAKYAAGMAYEAQFEGYRALVMNKPFANSKVFDSMYDPDKHDIMILFGVKPGGCEYSIFCNKPDIDVSKIAVKYGGGGHQGAAGFYTDKPIL